MAAITDVYKIYHPAENFFYSPWLYGNHTARGITVIKNSSLYQEAFTIDGQIKCYPRYFAYTGTVLIAGGVGIVLDLVRNILALLSVYYAGKRLHQFLANEGPFAPNVLNEVSLPGGSIVTTITSQISPPAISGASYDCSQEEKDNVRQMMINISDHNMGWLLYNIFEIKRIESAIKNVHPFAFLQILKEDPECNHRLPTLMEGFRWGWVTTNGIEKTARTEHEKGNLLPHVDSFARNMGRDPEKVRQFINENNIDMTGLASYLFKE
ncbi:MAG TPA: hypothetical protein VLG44_08115 [Chlamydiales bacterium]|nr:hypothetical protein [Chlamydiales bacterium]